MTIQHKQDGPEMTVSVSGRLDTTTAPDLSKALINLPDDVKKLIIDFNQLEYISSAGLRVLLSAQKSMAKRGGMTIINSNQTVQEVFEITGFVGIVNVEN